MTRRVEFSQETEQQYGHTYTFHIVRDADTQELISRQCWTLDEQAAARWILPDEEYANAFEEAAYGGYVAYGYSMSDGYYAPIGFDAFKAYDLRLPVETSRFQYNTEFHPTEAEVSRYNAVRG